MSPDLTRMFAPRGIALVGATDGSHWTHFLRAGLESYPGNVVVVHPKRDSVLGIPAFTSLTKVDGPVDLAYILTGPGAVESVLDDMAAAGVDAGIVLASGYSEAGADGLRAQHRLAARARELGIALLGPNSMGFVNPHTRTSAFGRSEASASIPGGVAVIMQSGALAGGIQSYMHANGIGLSLLVSTGNEAVVTTVDLLRHVTRDGVTRAVALFLEHVPDPAALRRAVSEAAAAGVAVVALKVGRSEAGKRAAQAHTGALAGDAAIASAALRQFGVIEARSLEELLSTAGLLAHLPVRPRGPRVAILTASGGAADILADRAADVGLVLPELAEATAEAIRPRLPSFATLANPLDVTGFERPELLARHTRTLDQLIAVLDDGNLDAILAVMALPAAPAGDPDAVERRIEQLGEIVTRSATPVVLGTYTSTALNDFQRDLLRRNGLHFAAGLESAVAALGNAVRWTAVTGAAARNRPEPPAADPAERASGPWSEFEARTLVAAHGVPLPPAALTGSAAEAVAAAERFGLPVALKICSPAIAHKTDVGGVRLGLATAEAVADAYTDILAAVGRRAPEAAVDGVLVTPMRPAGVDLIAGVHTDPQFGPVLTLGLGGLWVEVLEDVAHRVLPVDAADVHDMLGELRGSKVLRGARGAAPVDVGAVVDAVLRLCAAAAALGPSLDVVELNPLVARPDGVEALDVLLITH